MHTSSAGGANSSREQWAYTVAVFASLLAELDATGSVRFAVRVRPHAPRTRATAVLDDASIKIDVAAPAEGGKANAELLKYLAREFGVPRRGVVILVGSTDRHKVIKVERQS